MRWSDDAALLDALGAALAPAPAAPSADDLATLRALVEQGGAHEVVVLPVTARRQPRRPLAHAALVAAAVIVGVVVVGALAFAAGAPVPSGLRAPARALGFSVDSYGATHPNRVDRRAPRDRHLAVRARRVRRHAGRDGSG